MTRDEARAQCIEAIFRGVMTVTWEEAERALDSLHGIATVNPIEATEEMIDASYEKERDLFGPTACGLKHSVIFETMSAVGDLTNGPEKKP